MSNTSTIVLTNSPDCRDSTNASGALGIDELAAMKEKLEKFGTVVSVVSS